MLELFRSPRRALVWLVEASLIWILAVSAAGVTSGWGRALGQEQILRALFICAVTQASMYYHGLYDPRPMPRGAFAKALLRALLAASAALWLLARFFPGPAALRAVAATALSAAALVLPAWRAAWLRIERVDGFRRSALLLGGGPLARACVALIERDPSTGLSLVGALGEGEELGAPRLGAYADLARVAADRRVSHVIVACEERRSAVPLEALLELQLGGVTIEDGAAFHERAGGKVYLPALRPSDLLFCSAQHGRAVTLVGKRALDLFCAAAGLVLAAPILAVAALAIKLDSPGPILYTQVRAGERGRPFRMHKLRSMRTDAEARGARWAAEDDPRVTRVGRFLRRTRIDEIPQLWNVLVGEMSLVGPRPERPVFARELERAIPFFRQRLAVKPGVTGHAQVRCRYGASVDDAREKLAYDLHYIRSLSLWFDLSILVDTVKVVVLRVGSR
jgi:sugar transferase (PEP-CTERM system associated)